MRAIPLAVLLGLLTVCGADWPQLSGLRRDGISTETGLLMSWPKNGPTILWQKETGSGHSGPVVSGERAILFHRLGDKDLVQCFDAATGKEHWQFSYVTTYQDEFGMD